MVPVTLVAVNVQCSIDVGLIVFNCTGSLGAEALKSDVLLLESGQQDVGSARTLVPKALDADDEHDPGPSDDDDDSDEVRWW